MLAYSGCPLLFIADSRWHNGNTKCCLVKITKRGMKVIYMDKVRFSIIQRAACLLGGIILMLINATSLKAESNDFEIDGTTLVKYHGTAEEVTIPEGITDIHISAFEDNTTLKKILFPVTLTRIGKGAFINCQNLKSIDFPSELQIIDNMAFMDCDSLEKVNLSEGITEIGAEAFSKCDALKTVTISANVETIGDGVFAQCRNLQNISVNDTNKFYSEEEGVLFNIDGTELIQFPCGYEQKRYAVPDGVVTIGRDAFQGADIERVSIPEGAQNIEEHAFSGCSALEIVSLPTTINSIKDYAFSSCGNLRQIKIPSSNVEISKMAFKDSTSVKLYGIKESTVQQYAKDENMVFVDIDKDEGIELLIVSIVLLIIIAVIALVYNYIKTDKQLSVSKTRITKLKNKLEQAGKRERSYKETIKQYREKLEIYEKTTGGIASPDLNMKHIQLFMISPYDNKYKILEEAIKHVFEEAPFFFEVRLARDYYSADTQMENVKKHIASAHGFIAEISERNANVMMEIGGILMTGDSRPVFSLCQKQCNKDVPR